MTYSFYNRFMINKALYTRSVLSVHLDCADISYVCRQNCELNSSQFRQIYPNDRTVQITLSDTTQRVAA